jgi:hypothetical protein
LFKDWASCRKHITAHNLKQKLKKHIQEPQLQIKSIFPSQILTASIRRCFSYDAAARSSDSRIKLLKKARETCCSSGSARRSAFALLV